MTLEALPLTPSGKIDRDALPAPGRAQTAVGLPGMPPRYFLELRLCALFEEILGVDRVGVRDDFFSLGGNSLLAVRLQARVERDFGKRFDLPELFRGATVEHLAALLQRAEATESPGCLVPIRAGGPGLPFFWVHPSGGDVLCYGDLARHLGADRPSYGLRSRALLTELPPHESVDAMVAEYVDAVRAVSPLGPYLLGGWSLGGVVALEMARRLREGGAEVALLAMLDTQLPDAARAARLGEWELLGMFAAALGVRDLPPPAREELEAFDPDSRLQILLERARAAEVFPPEIGAADVRRFYSVFRANTRALQTYQPCAWPGRLDFFRATGGRPDSEPPARGWTAFAGSVELPRSPSIITICSVSREPPPWPSVCGRPVPSWESDPHVEAPSLF